MNVFIEAGISWAASKLADGATRSVAAKLREKAAVRELGVLAAEAMEVAVFAVPAFANDLRSEAFLQDVLGPMVVALVADPTQSLSKDDLAAAYLTRFVEPYLRDRPLDDVLSAAFNSDRGLLESALGQFLVAFRRKLYGSQHWRDAARDWAAAEAHQRVADIHRSLGLSDPPADMPPSVERARADANTVSQELKGWPQAIEGIHIDRPELPRLLARLKAEPAGRTLVIGEPGAGKSALFAKLTAALQEEGANVFAIKADLLSPDIKTIEEMSRDLGVAGDVGDTIEALAQTGPVVLLIDQLDAVSSVMDRTSSRMRLLIQLANRFRDRPKFKGGELPVHVVVSSRPFEAAHDGRFRSLQAEEMKLALPEYGRIEAALQALGIDPAGVPEGLRDSLRRLFALKLFVGLVRRGADVSKLSAGELLNEWLSTADLGEPEARRRALSLFTQLAEDMTLTETLWRPLDLYEPEHLEEIARGEACGLLMRQEGRVGFCHQAWLDNFQARGFRTADALVTFAWDRQDGLFARSTILRGLERMRAHDPGQYMAALDRLLGDQRTRRHIKHLAVDLIASQEAPLDRESGWVKRFLGGDYSLARRAVQKLAPHWRGWREGLLLLLPALMGEADLLWSATVMLHAEADFDAEKVVELVQNHWADADHDLDAFLLFQRAGLWNSAVEARVEQVLDHHPQIQPFTVGQFIEELVGRGRIVEALRLLKIYLREVKPKRHERLGVHGLDKLVAADPCALAKELMPWFVGLAPQAANTGLRNLFARGHHLEFDWQDDDNDERVLPAFARALGEFARRTPDDFRAFITPYLEVEVAEIQALIAEAIAEGGAPLATFGLKFLVGDSRRLWVGDAHLTDIHDVGHLVQNWSTKLLIRSLGQHLPHGALEPLRAAIEAWEPYRPEARESLEVSERKLRLAWSEENRLELLAELPSDLLPPRRLRQVREWQRTQPQFHGGGRRHRLMASWVGSPMSESQMERATDDDIARMLDEVRDGTERFWRKGRPHVGGVIELSRAFAAFAKSHPERALAIVRTRLMPGAHEYAAGQVIHELGGVEAVDTEALLDVVRLLHAKGFATDSWRRDASWGLREVARRRGGLPDADVAMIESWIVDDPELIEEQVNQRQAFKERNRKDQEAEQDQLRQCILFGVGSIGLTVLPQDNYTVLSAIAAGLLHREPAAYDAWLEVLESHIERPENPEIWQTLIADQVRFIYWADRDRAHAFMRRLWERFPSAFMDLSVVARMWRYRAIVPRSVRLDIQRAWVSSGDNRLSQAAGEFVMAAALVDPADDETRELSSEMLSGAYGRDARLGCLFAAAAAWRESGSLRDRAHEVLVAVAHTATGPEAEAVSDAVDRVRSLPGDARTEALLWAVAANRDLLKACLNNRFADALQDLLTYPGFEELILRLGELCGDEAIARGRGSSIDDDFVAIAVALQRQAGPHRARAMDLYERLLDGEVYGAAEAAAAALRA